MISLRRLTSELRVGLPVSGCGVVIVPSTTDASPTTYHTRPDGLVRVSWASVPAPAQQAQAESIVAAHDGTETEVERLDKYNYRQRVLAAVIIRTSTHWAALSAARKARVQTTIDNAAAEIIALLT